MNILSNDGDLIIPTFDMDMDLSPTMIVWDGRALMDLHDASSPIHLSSSGTYPVLVIWTSQTWART